MSSQGISRDEVTALAETRYDIEDYDDRASQLFALLVEIGDAYVLELEESAAFDEGQDEIRAALGDDPRPRSLGEMMSLSPLEIAMRGLQENLEMRRKIYGDD